MSKRTFFAMMFMLLLLTFVFGIILVKGQTFYYNLMTSVTPESPTTNDEVYVTVSLEPSSISYNVNFSTFSQSGNQFFVTIDIYVPDISIPVIGYEEETYHLGNLPEGTYNFTANVHVWSLSMGWLLDSAVHSESFNVTAPQLELMLETDKSLYVLEENVTITLTNIGSQIVEIGGYPAWQIFTYPTEEPVYPMFFATLIWSLEPGENDSFTWNQFNEFTLTSVEPGTYVVRDTHGWELSAYFQIVAAEIIVPDDYPTIQEAINNAHEGDTIFVFSGTYYEHVVVNKTVSLIGEGATLTAINGNHIGRTVVIEADNVTISNFRIEEGGFDIIANDCSLFINGSNSQILNSDIGWGGVISVLVDALSFNNTIKNNRIAGGARGLILLSSNNTIIQNHIETSGLLNVGAFGSNNTILNNYIRNDGGWPLVLYDWNKVSGNIIELVTPYDDFSGISIIGDFNIEGHNTITNNTIICSAIGSIDVFGIAVASSNNTIYHNNFFNYTQPVLIEKPAINTWDDGYPSGGNYWSDYSGTDVFSGPYQNETQRDGIGDTPYIFDENNTDNYPLMYPYPCPTVPWDITGPTEWAQDGKCDIRDIAQIASLFGTVESDGSYDQRADITGVIYLLPDGKIDIRDIALAAIHFGENFP